MLNMHFKGVSAVSVMGAIWHDENCICVFLSSSFLFLFSEQLICEYVDSQKIRFL